MIRNSEERKTWSREAMLAAVLAVKSGNERLRSASKIYKVPKSTLARYVKSAMDPEESVHGLSGGNLCSQGFLKLQVQVSSLLPPE